MTPDPIQYPKVQIGPDLVEVKFRCGDIIRLQKAGIDIADMSEVRGVAAMERALTLLSAGIAHQTKKTAEELGDLIDLADLPKVSEAIGEAFRKAFSQPAASQTTQDRAPAIQ